MEGNLKLRESLGALFKVGEPDSNGVEAGRNQLCVQRMIRTPAWLCSWSGVGKRGWGKVSGSHVIEALQKAEALFKCQWRATR